MTSMSMAFPVKPGTRGLVNKWFSGAPSSFGNYSIDDYRSALRRAGIIEAVWSCQVIPGGGELFTMSWTATGDAKAARDAFLGVTTGVEQWCKDQLTLQATTAVGPVNPSALVDTWQILPYP